MTSLKSLYPPVSTAEPSPDIQTRLQNIRPYYLFALLILVILAVFSYLGLRQLTTSQETSSMLINVSGRQRMLSQRITLLATLLTNENNPDNRAVWRSQLSNAIVQFGMSHDQVTQGRLPGDLQYELSAEINTLYFDEPTNLDRQVRNFLMLAGNIVAAPDDTVGPNNSDFLTLLDADPVLLASLEALTSQYIREENTHIQALGNLESLLFIATLMVLALVTILIFYPMERRIRWEQRHLLSEIDMHKEAEVFLLRSESLYRTLAQNLPDTAVLLFDRDMRYLLVEGSVLLKMGYSKDKLEGKILQEVLSPEAVSFLEVYYQRALNGEIVEFERQIPSGMIYHAHITPIRDASDQIIAGLLTVHDISRRKQAEAELQAAQRLNERILANTPDMIYIYDVEKQQNIFESRSLGVMLSYTSEQLKEAKDRDFSDFVHPEDAHIIAQNYQNLQSCPEDAPPLDIEFRLRDAEGKWRWFSGRNTVFSRHPDNRVQQIIGRTHNIHERKQTQIALQKSEARLQLAMDITRMGTWDWNLVTNENHWDASTKRILGNLEDFVESFESFLLHIHPEDRELVAGKMRESVEKQKALDLEYRIMHPDGEVRWLYSKGELQFDENQMPVVMRGIIQDITERKALEKQAFDLVVDREYGRMLADFIRDSSHDLRTPLSIINTSLYLLKKTEDAAKRLERIENIELQVGHMDRLIEDLHMMSNLDMATEVKKSSTKINLLINTIVEVYRKRLADKNQNLVLELAPELPEPDIDGNEVGHALSNILDNALLYTPEGGTITIESAQKNQHLVLSIMDTGIGIDGKHLDYIFDRFYKVDPARPTGKSGPGLGLTMVKKIVEMHGGYVEVKSKVGEGTCFMLYFPLSDNAIRAD